MSDSVFTSRKGFDAGSTYFTFTCASVGCGETLGRRYITTSQNLDEIRNKFTFFGESLSTYELGKATFGKVAEPEIIDFAAEGLDTSSSRDTFLPNVKTIQADIIKMKHLISDHAERITILEQKETSVGGMIRQESTVSQVTNLSWIGGDNPTQYQGNKKRTIEEGHDQAINDNATQDHDNFSKPDENTSNAMIPKSNASKQIKFSTDSMSEASDVENRQTEENLESQQKSSEENELSPGRSALKRTRSPVKRMMSPSLLSESSEKSNKSPTKKKSVDTVFVSPAKKRKLENSKKELLEKIEGLRKDLSRAKSKQRELENPKFPVKDELLFSIDLKGVELVELPPFTQTLDVPKHLVSDVLSVTDFMTLFSKQLSLTPMTINDFVELIKFNSRPTVALTELCCALIKQLLADPSTANRLSAAIPKRLLFSYQPKSLKNQSNGEIIHEVTVDNLEYDTSTNCLRLLPGGKLESRDVNALTYQPILRSIIMRLENVQRLRKAVAQLEYAQATLGKSKDRRLSRRLSLNKGESKNASEPVQESSKVQYLRDKDAVLGLTGDALKQLTIIQQAAMELDEKEFYSLSFEHKMAIIRVLCDACFDTDTLQQVLESNEQDRNAKIQSINKQIRDEKLAAKEESAAKRDAAIAACKKANIAAAKTAKGKNAKKSTDPTPAQIQAKLEEMVLLESIEVDEVVPAVEIDMPSDDESDDEDMSSRRRSRQRISAAEKNKLRVEAQSRLSVIESANEAISYALQTESEKDIKQAIKVAIRAGLRWEERGKTYCTELLKQAYKLQSELEATAKEDRLRSQIEKALIEYPVRTLPLGSDRYNREYFVFGDDLRVFVRYKVKNSFEEPDADVIAARQKLLAKSDGAVRLLCNSPPSECTSEWGYYASKKGIWDLCQALDSRGEREKALKAALISRFELEEPEVVFLTEGNEYIGRKVCRRFKNKRTIKGTIIGWLPQQDDDIALWHVLHEDGDEEDLELHEVEEYVVPEENIENDVTQVSKVVRAKSFNEKSKRDPPKSVTSKDEEAEFDDDNENEDGNEDEDEDAEVDGVDEPYITTFYHNHCQRHQQAFKINQIGLSGLQQEFLEVQALVIDGFKQINGNYAKADRKTWETLVRESSDFESMQSALLELEETIHSAQTIPDKKEEEEILKERELQRKALEDEGWNFNADSNEFIGRSARRFFPGYGISDGSIIAYFAPESNEGQALWRLEHDDGDQEDLDEQDLLTALRHFDNNCKEDDNVMGGDMDDEPEDASEDDDDYPAKRDGSTFASTLWPTSGVRNRWISAVNKSKTLGELALGLASLVEYAKAFGAIEESLEQSKSKLVKKKSASPIKKKKSDDWYDDYKRPSREATKKVKSYAEN